MVYLVLGHKIHETANINTFRTLTRRTFFVGNKSTFITLKKHNLGKYLIRIQNLQEKTVFYGGEIHQEIQNLGGKILRLGCSTVFKCNLQLEVLYIPICLYEGV